MRNDIVIKLMTMGMFIGAVFATNILIYPFQINIEKNIFDAKEFVVLFIMSPVIMFAIYKNMFKPFCNKWFLILMGYLFINALISPVFVTLTKTDVVVNNFWVYKAYMISIVLFLFLWAISSVNYDESDINNFFSIFKWCGIISAVYAIGQRFGIDDFFRVDPSAIRMQVTHAEMGGFIGYPNYLASFLSICVPFYIYKKEWFWLAVVCLTIFLTSSNVAIGATVIGCMIYAGVKFKKTLIISGIILAVLIGIYTDSRFHPQRYQRIENERVIKAFQDSGRFALWGRVWREWKRYFWFGYGYGSYEYIYLPKFKDGFRHAHNEPLEFAFGVGAVGLILLIASLGWTFIKSASLFQSHPFTLPIVTGSAISFLNSLGIFLWQREPTRIFTVILFGILLSIIRKKGEENEKINLNNSSSNFNKPCLCG